MRTILGAVFKTGSGSAVSAILNALAHKIMAVILGPAGIGLYSLLHQITITASTGATIGGGTAIVQGIASRKETQRGDYTETVFWLLVGAGLLVGGVLAVFAPWIAPATLGDGSASSILLIRSLAVPVFLYSLLVYIRGVLNGFRAIGRLALSYVVAAAALAILAYPASHLVDRGHTVAFVWLMSASFSAGLVFCLGVAIKNRYVRPFRDRRIRPRIVRSASRHFFSIAGTTLLTGLLATGVLLLIRSMIVQTSGLDGAGIFNVAWTIGMTYAVLVLSSFGTYYLPTLSGEKNPASKIMLMKQMLKVCTLLITPLLVIAILLKPLLVSILYSDSFYSALETLRWMLIADYVKAGSWVLAMPMLAYAEMRIYFITESAWYVGFLAISTVSIMEFESIEGVGIAYLAMYCAYLAYVLRYAKRRHGFTLGRREYLSWLVGALIVVTASYQTWNSTVVDWPPLMIWIPVLLLFGWFSLSKKERGRLKSRLAK